MITVQTVDILGVPFASLTQEQALCILEGYLDTAVNHVIVTPNPEGVMQSRRNPAFREALCNADLSLADGTGVVLASWFLNRRLPERVRGVDISFALFERLCERERSFTAYFLGATSGVAENAKRNMEARFPYLKVVGLHHGFFDTEKEAEILDEINRLSPDILFVCTGMPRAELWADTHRGALPLSSDCPLVGISPRSLNSPLASKKINARITLCVGGTLDIMGGNVKLAPAFVRKIGMEWFYRLLCQPSRTKRMLDIPRFVLAVLFVKGDREH
ncbi:MAG: WecB/TagA/CpsF family glycosyltransferase [Defluviitaleaceae bacterium]|nr:WecB/TagA/CpsF family glycosyltransferase [Defluviitaleaceae bacterium]